MFRVLMGLAAVVLSSAVLVHAMATASAYPSGPEVTGGEAPWVSLTGSAPATASTTIYTVPDDRMLVVTGAIMQRTSVHMYEDSVMKVNGYSRVMVEDNTGFLTSGRGRIAFAAGSNVVLNNESSAAAYTIQGYLAHP